MNTLENRIMSVVQKVSIIGFMLIGAAVCSWSIYLDSYYCEYGATTTVVGEGRVYARKVCHGRQVFMTEKEKFNLDVLFPSISIASVLIAGLLDLRWKHFAFKRNIQGRDLLNRFRRDRKK
jgi:hypothetical protein